MPARKAPHRKARRAWQAHLSDIHARVAAIDRTLSAIPRRDYAGRLTLTVKRDVLRSGLFDPSYYLAAYPDVRGAGIDPLDHYIAFGAREGRKPNRIFDTLYYRRAHAEECGSGTNPLAHYVREGEAAGLKPAQSFDPRAYLVANPACAAAGLSPLWHALHFGAPGQAQSGLNPPARLAVAKPLLRRWARPARGGAGVNFIGPVEMMSGLGTSARGYVAALEEARVAVNLVPWRQGFERQERLEVRHGPAPAMPINLVHLNADMAHVWLPALAHLLTAERYNIAIWYWELPSFRHEWLDVVARFDEIWCASTFTHRSIESVSARPVRVVRPAVPPRRAPARMTRRNFSLGEGSYIFFYVCDVCSRLNRKNPHALVRAFIEEFAPEEGAMLLLKLNYPGYDSGAVEALRKAVQQRPDVVLMDRMLPADELADLWTLVDCYVSPHRSEGLGLTVIEAMHAGLPVAGTPYGGVVDLLTPETGLPLDYALVEIERTVEPYPAGFVWADPRIASIRTRMRWAFENRAAARSLGEAGRRYVSEMFSVARTGAAIRSEIDRIWAADGSGSRREAVAHGQAGARVTAA